LLLGLAQDPRFAVRMAVKHDFVRGRYGVKQAEKGVEEN